MAVRRKFLLLTLLFCCILAPGCRKKQYAHVLKQDDRDMVGSHNAGR